MIAGTSYGFDVPAIGILLWIPGLPFVLYFLVYVLWVTVAQLFASAYNTLPGEMAYEFDDRTQALVESDLIRVLEGLFSGGIGQSFDKFDEYFR
ncbi:hypothetical protein [Bifidobacterium sp. ESL0704]|uniref:hypothetical protein n=1 Tax=Bifidobacterium sp. ESL0704 TaxID=2983219 RepID=UPI0023FA46C4|nr:hypothetical protein [Bifidobacterium sp. ESL0704]WEV52815.1 hypothetical protein OZX64_08155 [Bifidobacterium sp. ESL0704]